MVLSVVAKLAAMVRETVIAAIFGASVVTDAYGIAMVLPNLAVTLVSSALSSVAVPFFMDHQGLQERELARRLFWLSTAILMVVSVLLWLFGPALLAVVMTRLGSVEQRDTATLMRWFTLLVLPSSFAALASARLYARRRFGAASLAPALGTAVTALLVMLLPHTVWALGFAFAAGAGLQWLVVGVGAASVHQGALLEDGVDGRAVSAWSVWRLMLPQMLSGAVGQINLLVDRVFAAYFLAVGSIAEMTFGSRLLDIPVAVFGSALATTLYPDLTQAASSGDSRTFTSILARDIRRVTTLTLPISAWLLSASFPISAALYGHGHFGPAATRMTARVLEAYAPLLTFRSVQGFVARAFYAQRDTLTLGRLSLVALPLNAMLDYLFMRLFGLVGIAAATTLVGASYACTAFIVLVRRHRGLMSELQGMFFVKLLFATLLWLGVTVVVMRPLATQGVALQLIASLILALFWIPTVRQLAPAEWTWLRSLVMLRAR